jgi:hypothetical protein
MKKSILIVFFFISSFSVFCQSYDIGIFGGVFTPIDFWYYVDGEIGTNTGVKFNYHFNEKMSISSNYFHGNFHFSPAGAEERVNGQRLGNERARVSFDAVSFIFFRKFNLNNNWKIHLGTGIGYYLENLEGETNYMSGKKYFVTDFTMPIEVNFNKEIFENVIIGIKSGTFLTPFYLFGGFYLGPEVYYRF